MFYCKFYIDLMHRRWFSFVHSGNDVLKLVKADGFFVTADAYEKKMNFIGIVYVF